MESPRFADAEQLAQDLNQIVPRHRDQRPFAHVDQSTQPTAALTAGFADVGEASFAQFAPLTLELLALGTLDSTPVVGHAPLVLGRFVDPMRVAFPLPLGDIRPQLHGVAVLDGGRRVIPLVDDLFDLQVFIDLFKLDLSRHDAVTNVCVSP